MNIRQCGTARWNLKRVCSALNNTRCLVLETDKDTALLWLWVNAPKRHSENPLKICQLSGFYNIRCVHLYNSYLYTVSTSLTANCMLMMCPPVWQLSVRCVHQYDNRRKELLCHCYLKWKWKVPIFQNTMVNAGRPVTSKWTQKPITGCYHYLAVNMQTSSSIGSICGHSNLPLSN